jgi:hypothetical protein
MSSQPYRIVRWVFIVVFVLAFTTYSGLWEFGAQYVSIPHVGAVIAFWLLVEFVFGFVTGFTLNRRRSYYCRLRLDRI